MLGAEFASLKIASAAECYRTCVAKSFPKPLRTLYRGGRTRASNRFTSDDAAIDVIERHDHELDNLGHGKSSLGEISGSVFHRLFLKPIGSAVSLFDANQRRRAPQNGAPSSSVPRQLPVSPMVVFARRVERPFDVTVQGSHNANSCKYRRIVVFCDE
jgi:hypothetical protein